VLVRQHAVRTWLVAGAAVLPARRRSGLRRAPRSGRGERQGGAARRQGPPAPVRARQDRGSYFWDGLMYRLGLPKCRRRNNLCLPPVK